MGRSGQRKVSILQLWNQTTGKENRHALHIYFAYFRTRLLTLVTSYFITSYINSISYLTSKAKYVWYKREVYWWKRRGFRQFIFPVGNQTNDLPVQQLNRLRSRRSPITSKPVVAALIYFGNPAEIYFLFYFCGCCVAFNPPPSSRSCTEVKTECSYTFIHAVCLYEMLRPDIYILSLPFVVGVDLAPW
jgi:hypothetical protein